MRKPSLKALKAGPRYYQSGALFTKDGRHRLSLSREFRGTTMYRVKIMTIIGMNPSTASATEDDATIRKCVAYAEREGCTRLEMINMLSLCETDPKKLPKESIQAFHPDNVDAILTAARKSSVLVAAWGSCSTYRPSWGAPAGSRKGVNPYEEAVYRLAQNASSPRDLWCFGLNADRTPKHPLYLPGVLPLVPYKGTAFENSQSVLLKVHSLGFEVEVVAYPNDFVFTVILRALDIIFRMLLQGNQTTDWIMPHHVEAWSSKNEDPKNAILPRLLLSQVRPTNLSDLELWVTISNRHPLPS